MTAAFGMEVYFPEHSIRYIALNDNVDTLNASSLDIAPFRNLLNDMYSQDISKKIKSALYTRQSQGKHIGNKAPYGYIKDPQDKNHLIIDERCAPVVRKIYELYLDGNGVHRIAAALRAEKIPKPAAIAAEYFNNTYASHISTDMDILGQVRSCRDGMHEKVLSFPHRVRSVFSVLQDYEWCKVLSARDHLTYSYRHPVPPRCSFLLRSQQG